MGARKPKAKMSEVIKQYPFCWKGHQYALDIVAKKIVASKYVIGACQRYLRDLDNTEANFFFDPEAAEKYLRLVQQFDHPIGKWKDPKLIFEPWQCWVWSCIMGFVNRATGFRRFRMAHLEVARGNGKSPMASQAALYFLCLDDPNGNQISTVATKKDQARIVFDSARTMAKKNKTFCRAKGVHVLAHSITHQDSSSVMRPLASESSGLDGLNDVLAILDELHAMKRETFDVVYSGMSKRADSLTLCITTAGFDIDGIGYSQSTYAKKVCLGEVEDDQFFAAVYCLDEEDHWADEETWIKANPNLGVSVDIVTLRAKVEKALVTPADIPNIKVKHMNLWLSEANAFFDQGKWDKCADKTLKFEDFKGKTCRIGVDLASHLDLASVGYVFYDRATDIYTIFDRTFVPEETVKQARNVMYDDCIAKGALIQTPGQAISFEAFRKDIEANFKLFRIVEGLYDTWNSEEMSQKLSDKIEMLKFPMTVANFSEPMKKLDAMIREGRVRHNGSPLLRWCLGNMVAKEDHNGNVFPRKNSKHLKIDPIIAILMALAGWLRDETKDSVYESRGIRTL